MATRIEEILLRVRDTLADPRSERWTDARLLRLLDEGYKVLTTKAKMLRSKAEIPLAVGISEYTVPPTRTPRVTVVTATGATMVVSASPLAYAVPNDIHKFTRAVNHLGEPITFISHTEADRLFGANWGVATGPTVQYLIFDKQDQNKFRVYPIPDNSITGPTTAQLATLNSLYGITVAGGLESTYDLMSSPFGVVVGVSQVSNTSFTLYYVRMPRSITQVTDNLETSEAYDAALKFYICGMALRDDKDVQNRSLGNEELRFFTDGLTEAIKESSLDFSANETKYDVPYTGGF